MIRIYPALLTLAVVTLLLAACFGKPGLLSDPQAWVYGLHAAFPSLALLTTYRLPGVFESNPYPGIVNGSLWTLPWELRMYALLGLTWLASRGFRSSGDRLLNVALVTLALLGVLVQLSHPDSPTAHLVFMFFSGASYHVLRRHVTYRLGAAAVCAAAMAISTLYRPAFLVTYHLFLGYILFTLAFVPRLWRPRHACERCR